MEKSTEENQSTYEAVFGVVLHLRPQAFVADDLA